MIARDLGEPPLSSAARVKVVVKDINDNSPELDCSNSSAYNVSYDQSEGGLDIILSASDRDVTDAGKLEYMILSGKWCDMTRDTSRDQKL